MSVIQINQSPNKKQFCKYCGKHAHPFTTRCNYGDLIKRIEVLSAANACIPKVVEENIEATTLAKTFQALAKDVTAALTICEVVVKDSLNGEEIWRKFEKRLEEEWPKKFSHLGTEESTKISNHENTIQSETESKPCIVATTPGENTAQDSLRQIQNAMLVGEQLPLWTI